MNKRTSEFLGIIVALICLVCICNVIKTREKKIAMQEQQTALGRAQGKVTMDSLNEAESGYVMSSYYALEYHGRRQANGTFYDMNQMTCAHLRLPFGTIVRVTREVPMKVSIEKKARYAYVKKSVELEVTDRGPYIQGRELDVSRAAAIKLGMIGSGVSMVYIEIIRIPKRKQ